MNILKSLYPSPVNLFVFQDVAAIMNETLRGRIIVACHKEFGQLNDAKRNTVCDIIVSHYLQSNGYSR